MVDEIKNVLERAIAEKVFPGAVVGTVDAQGQRSLVTAGHLMYEPGAPEVKADTIYDTASITKSIPTAMLALQLIEQGRLNLNQPIKEFLPELRAAQDGKITIWHLLTQTLDWGFSMSALKDKSADEILQGIFQAELKSPPHDEVFYSNATSIVLGLVVERVTKDTLDSIAKKGFFDPLGMANTTFHPENWPEEKRGHIAPTEADAWRGYLLQGEVHDESAWKLRSKIIAGSAGLFSTVPDLLNFMEMILRRGELNGRIFFQPQTISQMITPQLKVDQNNMGLGWDVNNPLFMGRQAPSLFGKTGFVGSMAIGDLAKGKAMVMLSNNVYPKRPQSNRPLHAVRCELADIVFT